MPEQTDKNSMNKAPKVYDLAQIDRAYNEAKLKKAIQTHDLPTAAACLRQLDYEIPPDIVEIITDRLIDPATTEKYKYKEGPKPKKKRLFVERNMTIHLYKVLCENKVLPTKKEIKLLVCNMYGMKGTRTFEKWLAEYNKK